MANADVFFFLATVLLLVARFAFITVFILLAPALGGGFLTELLLDDGLTVLVLGLRLLGFVIIYG